MAFYLIHIHTNFPYLKSAKCYGFLSPNINISGEENTRIGKVRHGDEG
jgi:hypothetical protein